jgi:hypothetical protein
MPTLKPITITAATSLTRNVHADALILLDSTTGRILTLPASTGKGDTYRVYIPTTVSSGDHVVAALTTDIIQGAVAVATDIAGVTCPTTATSDKITMNGSTTGGLLGSYLELRDAKSGQWMVTGTLVSSGSEATPFSAS